MAKDSYRKDRIERLLHELRYEVERGLMEGEIDEHMGFDFVVPISRTIKDGVVVCRFRIKPEPAWYVGNESPKLKTVK